MSPTGRGRRGWGIPMLLVLAVVTIVALAFNVANLEPLTSSPLGPEPSRDPAAAAMEPIGVAVVWAIALLGVVFLVLMIPWRKWLVDRQGPGWSLLLPALGLLLVILFLAATPQAVSSEANETAANDGSGAAPGNDASPATWVGVLARGGTVQPLLGLVVVFALILWVFVRFRGSSMFTRGLSPIEAPDPRNEATAAVHDTIQELEIGAEVRTTILACFQRFCRLLRARGVAQQEPLTAHEIEALAVQVLAVSPDASASLTSLFEEARYSSHALGEVDRARAIADLGRIRAALEA